MPYSVHMLWFWGSKLFQVDDIICTNDMNEMKVTNESHFFSWELLVLLDVTLSD